MSKLEAAEPSSPIAVFKTEHEGKPALDCVFANTVETQNRLLRDHALVGVFNKTMSRDDVRRKLERAIGG